MVRFKEMVSEALDTILASEKKKFKIEPKGLRKPAYTRRV